MEAKIEKLKKNDFIELDFTGKDKEGKVFDTTIKEEAKKINIDIADKPLIICLGQNMILPAIDEFLIGKEIGNYALDLKPEKAFGKRDRKLVKLMPSSLFKEQGKLYPGMVFSFDNMLGKIMSVSGGRIMIDFNNPLADKEVIYQLNIKRKIEDLNEKAKSLIIFFFKREMPFKLETNKLVIEAEKQFIQFIILFKEKFREILNLDLEVKEVEKKTEDTIEEEAKTEKAEAKKEDKPDKIEKQAEN